MSYFRDQLEAWLLKLHVTADCVADFGGAAKPVTLPGRLGFLKANKYVCYDNLAENPDPSVTPIKVTDIDFSDPLEIVVDEDDQADVAFCLELMEYVWDPVTALRNMHALMREKGILFISFPFVYPIHNPVGRDYLRYTEEGVRKLMEKTGFYIEELTPRVAKVPGSIAGFYASDGMHPRKDKTVEHTGYLVKAVKVQINLACTRILPLVPRPLPVRPRERGGHDKAQAESRADPMREDAGLEVESDIIGSVQ